MAGLFLAGILILPNVGGGLWPKILGSIFLLGLILALGVPVLVGRRLRRGVPETHMGDTACTWADRPMSGMCFPFGW